MLPINKSVRIRCSQVDASTGGIASYCAPILLSAFSTSEFVFDIVVAVLAADVPLAVSVASRSTDADLQGFLEIYKTQPIVKDNLKQLFEYIHFEK